MVFVGSGGEERADKEGCGVLWRLLCCLGCEMERRWADRGDFGAGCACTA